MGQRRLARAVDAEQGYDVSAFVVEFGGHGESFRAEGLGPAPAPHFVRSHAHQSNSIVVSAIEAVLASYRLAPWGI